MKSTLVFWVILFLGQGISAQGGGVLVSAPNNRPVYMKEIFGMHIERTQLAGIDGTPFLFDQWLLARVQLPDDRIADSIYIRLNAFTNKVHFKNEEGEEMQASIPIKEITIIDNNPLWHNAIFRTGYTDDFKTFFLVLADGKKMQLVKKMMIIKWETKVLGGEDKRTFQPDQELFFSANGSLFKQNKKCSALTEIFGTNTEEVLRFINTNDIKCNREADMRKLVDYFNSL